MTLIAAAVDQTVNTTHPGNRGSNTASGMLGCGRELAYRSLRAELATAFNLSEYQTETQMDLAYRLTHCYTATLAALDRGEIAYAHARVIADAGMVIGIGEDPEQARRRAGYEHEVLQTATRETPNRLRPIAIRLAEQWAERTLEERHREAVTERRVLVIDGQDGMADLIARLPAVEAYAIHDRLTRIARAAEHGKRTIPTPNHTPEPGPNPNVDSCSDTNTDSEPSSDSDLDSDSDLGSVSRAGSGSSTDTSVPPRTRDQLRADAFTDLLLSADELTLFAGSTTEAIRARVEVILPLESTPAHAICELVGYGPIDKSTAHSIAAATHHWERVDTNHTTGEILAVDRYRPSAQIRRLVGTRDRHCRFPGCRVPISRCDLDHTIDAALGGPTSTNNLAHLCRSHHTLKHHSKWQVTQESDGTLHWTSPTGRQYVDRPPNLIKKRNKPDRAGQPEKPGNRSSSGNRRNTTRNERPTRKQNGNQSTVRFTHDTTPEICF